ncbi:hypothetical protein GFS31_33800 [Leptolyngbya sp. BL0902]|nr:hypothetical protein [Leptolyngbya sp. BL0902]QQE66680.1 hypothetical protein GFS31_33800 [Leptolyngbya sp. BL0902]
MPATGVWPPSWRAFQGKAALTQGLKFSSIRAGESASREILE